MVVAMLTVKELMLSPEGTAAEPVEAGAEVLAAAVAGAVVDAAADEGAELDEDEDDEQPAATMAMAAAAATTPSLGRILDVPWLCERECHPP
jgi:hypothetical protein